VTKKLDIDPRDALENLLTFRLVRLYGELNRQSSRLLKEAGGLTIPEWRIISLLGAHGEMNGRLIGKVAKLDAGLSSRTLRTLELRGIVQCVRRADDRRAVWTSLTPRGKKLEQTVRPVMLARHQRLLAALEPQERRMIFTLVDKLRAVIEEENAAAGSRVER
jgi:DNA-binding MarR family transcriptional regulator